jgi:pimeloyl-ACP methyl ester carboxylesterase
VDDFPDVNVDATMAAVARPGQGRIRLHVRSITLTLASLIGMLVMASCGLDGGPDPAATPTMAQTSAQCIDQTDPLPAIPRVFYQDSGSASSVTVPGDVICSNEINAPKGYRAWVLLYWVKQANSEFVPVSAVIAVSTDPAPPGGRPILSWAHDTPLSITDGCAPTSAAPRAPAYPIYLKAFLDAGFAVVGTDYVGLGMPGVHPYLVGKSEGAAVLAAARAAQNFGLAEASGPVIIMGHSQGGHAALYADWQSQHISFFAPGVEVKGAIATAPPTFLNKIASQVIANPKDFRAVMNLVITAGAWHRVYGLKYPSVLTKDGKRVANEASNPDTTGCYIYSGKGKLVISRKLPVDWTDMLEINTAPVGLLPAEIPVMIVQAKSDDQVPYSVTRAAVRDICQSGVSVTFVDLKGDHGAPLNNENNVQSMLHWSQLRIRSENVPNSCKK